MITSPAVASMRLPLRPMLVGMLAMGSMTLVACQTDTAQRAKRPRSTTTTSSSTTTTTPGPISYAVQPGDTLTKIAAFFGLPTTFLAESNHLANGDQLTIGQVLQIPRRPSIRLEIDPATSTSGEAFDLELVGAQAGEIVRFKIDAPGGDTFTGPPHTATPEGSVTAGYQSGLADAPGQYDVSATGDRGTSARASFRIKPEIP